VVFGGYGVPLTIKELEAGLPHITTLTLIQNKLPFTQAVGIGGGLLGGDYIELVDVSAYFIIDGEYVGADGESRQGVFTHLSCPKCKRKFRSKFWARAFCKLFFSCPALALSFKTTPIKII
jgi:hypothetical protein